LEEINKKKKKEDKEQCSGQDRLALTRSDRGGQGDRWRWLAAWL
jgi:hypothetical protein